MSFQFHKLKVRDLRRETADTVSISFELPESERAAFQFKQGQHLTLKTEIKGEEIRRSYSICTGTQENELRVAVKKVEGGLFSTWANEQLKAGDWLEVMAPQGHFFTELHPDNEKLYVAFAAGSGITPVMSILRSTLALEPRSRFILFYGNRSFDTIIFREQLEELKIFIPNAFLCTMCSAVNRWAMIFLKVALTPPSAADSGPFFDPKEVDAFFLCGPEEMVFDVKDALDELGADPKNVHFELFTTTGIKNKPAENTAVKEVFEASITVIQDGAQFDFNLPSDGSTLLDAAMRAGADLPFSCKGGVCSTCKARIMEGKVEMTVNYGLEPDEVEMGYVLTCQSHPTTKRVVVSFDA